MAVQELLALGLLTVDFIYHRYDEDLKKRRKNFADSVNFPQTEEGTPVPYVYGRVRVTRPILVWHSRPLSFDASAVGGTGGVVYYAASMFFELGVPFADGDSTNRLHTIWQGDIKFGTVAAGVALPLSAPSVPLEQLDGDGGYEDENRGLGRIGFNETIDGVTTSIRPGCVEFLNGNPNQQLCNPTSPYLATTRTGYQMMTVTPAFEANAKVVPGFRGVLSMLLYRWDETGNHVRFIFGRNSPQLSSYSAEVSSYKGIPSWVHTDRIGDDANPAIVIYDILTAKRKLGIPTSRIDVDSFSRAAKTLSQESHGFSRCFDARMPARDMIKEILKQIDAMLFEDTKTGKYKLKLIRPDHNVNDLLHITRRNCKKLQNLAISGLTGVPNKVQLVYTSRELGYVDDSVIAHDSGNAVAQDAEENEAQLSYPGITTERLASSVAHRELNWLTRPLIKCRALVFREFLDLEPGDAVRLTWSKPDISGLVFRVAGPPYHGTLRDNVIALDLISDNSYQYRTQPPQPPLPHPDIGTGLVLGLGMR